MATELLISHSQNLLSQFLAEKQTRPLILALTHAKRTDVDDGPTVTGVIMKGLRHYFDWTLWPSGLASHEGGLISSLDATPKQVAEALHLALVDGVSAAEVILQALSPGRGGCCFGSHARMVAQSLGACFTQVGHYPRTLRKLKSTDVHILDDEFEYDDTEEEILFDSIAAEDIECALAEEEEECENVVDAEFVSRFGSRSAPHPCLWVIPSYRRWATKVINLMSTEININLETVTDIDVKNLVRTATRAAANRRNAAPGIFEERSRIAIERWSKFTPDERSRIAIERWNAKTDEEKDAQRAQLRKAWSDKTEEEVAEIYSRSGESIRATLMAKTQEERSQPSLARWANKTTEERREHMSAAQASRNPAERSETTRRAQAAKTKEQRSASAKAGCANLTAEQRRKRTLDGYSKMTAEKRKEKAEKGVKKRAEKYEIRRQETEEIAKKCLVLTSELLVALEDDKKKALQDCVTQKEKALSELQKLSLAAKSVRSSKKAKELAAATFPLAISALTRQQEKTEV